MASARWRTDNFVWTDDEVELLLRVTLDYKASKCQENIDWESCQSKYTDIFEAFQQQYPTSETAGGKEFPHDKKSISKTQVTAKIKAIRGKYRQAVDSGRWSGHGRVILLFSELCEEIWGGSPATRTITTAIETAEMGVSVEGSWSSSTARAPSPTSGFSFDSTALDSPGTSEETVGCNLHPVVVKKRRDLLQVKLNGRRGSRQRRKLPAEPATQEDLQIKRRMLELMEMSDRRNMKNLRQITSNIATITNTIQEGFSLLRHALLQQQQQQPPYVAHPQSSSSCDGHEQMQGPLPPPGLMHTPLHSAHAPDLYMPAPIRGSPHPAAAEDATPDAPKDYKTIACDCCRKRKAAKSCLSCESSFCEVHLESHDAPNLKKHKLIDPVENPQMICKQHGLSLDLFCKTDKALVCVDCVKGDHKLHDTASVEEESKNVKNQLVNTTATVLQIIQEKEKEIEDVTLSVKQRKKNTEEEKLNCDQVFTALENCIKRNKTWLLELMEEKQKTAEVEAEGVITEREQEIDDLKRRCTELEQLSHTEDLPHLLQVYQSLCELPPTKDWSSTSTDTGMEVTPQKEALIKMMNDIDMEMEKIPGIELKRVQQYEVDVTLDPNTANPYLSLSDDGKRVENATTAQQLPRRPERFTNHKTVLGSDGFSLGKFYYEVMVKGSAEWSLGVARASIERIKSIKATPESGLWIVRLRRGNEYKACAGPDVPLSLKQKPQKVGVFVDYEEGVVSFYDVEARSHIYSFTGQSFTEKLYPYFGLCSTDAAPLIITPVERMSETEHDMCMTNIPEITIKTEHDETVFCNV